jgi:hypothetical protein
MKHSRLAPIFLSGILVAACASSPRSADVPKPASGNPIVGSKVVVREFDTSEAEIVGASTVKAYGLDIAKVISEALRKAGVDARVAPVGQDARGDFIVQGRVVAVDGGSSGAREYLPYAIGSSYGIGAGKFRAMGKVIRSNGETIGDFNRERRSGAEIDSNGTVQRCIDAVGYDIARMITTGHYTTGDD